MSDSESNVQANQDQTLAPRSPFGQSFLEKLLLAIIDAHPAGAETRDARLRSALHALLGEKQEIVSSIDQQDNRALLYMGDELHRDRGFRFLLFMKLWKEKKPLDLPKVRKDMALAKEATDKFYDPPNEQARKAIYDRLREKFSGSYYRKHGKGQGINYPEGHVVRATEHDYIAETVEAQSLDRMCEVLHRHGVNTKRKRPAKVAKN